MIQLSCYIVIFLTLYIAPSFATLGGSNSVDEVQARNLRHRLQVIDSLSEDNYLLELIVNIPMYSKSNNETTLCTTMGDQYPLTEYLGMVVNESGRKFLEKEATSKHIPVEDIVWFVCIAVFEWLVVFVYSCSLITIRCLCFMVCCKYFVFGIF